MSITQNEAIILKQKNLTKLRGLLRVVLRTNKFYQHKFGITSSKSIRTWGDFFSLPFTTKHDLVQDQTRRPPYGTNLTYPFSQYTYVINTSGTTGKQLFSPLTRRGFYQFAQAIAYGNKRLGITKNDVFLQLCRQNWFPIVAVATQSLGARAIPPDWYDFSDLLERIISMKVTVLHLYPTILHQITEVAEELNIDLKKTNVKKIITIGEIGGSSPAFRNFFAEKWNAQMIDKIGSIEAGTVGFTCKKQGYHMLDDLVVTEIIDEKGHPAIKGELVITLLWQYDSPLIRYRTGDMVELRTSPCECGWKTTMLRSGIIGRTDNQIKLRARTIHPEEIELPLKRFVRIVDYRIVCDNRRNLDTVDVYIELPLNTDYAYVESIRQYFSDILLFEPYIHVLFPKTLKRFGFNKGKRFIDLRKQTVAKLHQNTPVISLGGKMVSIAIINMMLLNSKIEKISKIFRYMIDKRPKS